MFKASHVKLLNASVKLVRAPSRLGKVVEAELQERGANVYAFAKAVSQIAVAGEIPVAQPR